MTSSRRIFLRQLTLSCGSVLFMPACVGYDSTWRFFLEREALTVIAFAEQIVPADHDPGATEAQVINFIDKQLTGPYVRFQKVYRQGIKAIESSSLRILGKPFYELQWDEQTHFLEQMEAGNLPEDYWINLNQKSFFNMLLEHSMQGFYGSPRHGGNKNYISYKMMKIDYPHVLGQNRYNVENSSLQQLQPESEI